MPIPKPHQGETRSEFMARCMSDPVMRDEFPENDVRAGVCSTQWEERSVKPNEVLLRKIQNRQTKRTEFNYGILTADRYVATVRDCAGLDICTRFACSKSASFNDAMEKAAQTLVYSNDEMRVKRSQRVEEGMVYTREEGDPTEIELPKNTLMAFTHVLTSPKKDRDGDILRTEGATVDPKMLLLWQHVHTLPIGKMLAIREHNPNRLVLVSAIVDLNELAHDAAVMIDNDMGRFSHGFRALEFNELKEDEGDTTSMFPGFEITKFEIMEASLVSVPSNTDAEVQEVLLGLGEGGKLTSDLMKEVCKGIREKRPLQTPGIELKEEEKNEDEPEDQGSPGTEDKGEGGEGQKCTCPPKQTDGDGAGEETKEAGDTEVKAGRQLSAKNLEALKGVKEDLSELMEKEDMSRGGSALCDRCVKTLGEIITAAGGDDEDKEDKGTEPTISEVIGYIVERSTTDEKVKLKTILDAICQQMSDQVLADEYTALIS